ncbi:MAG: hypothetical protein RL348_975, partial [Bacteroidota bacterium]
VSEINTVLFESESGDSTKTILRYELSNPPNDYTISFNETSFVKFKRVSIFRGSGGYSIQVDKKSSDLSFEQNILHGMIIKNSSNIKIIQNNLNTAFRLWGYQLIGVKNVFFEKNNFNVHYGVRVYSTESDSIYILNNNFTTPYLNDNEGGGISVEGVVKSLIVVKGNRFQNFRILGAGFNLIPNSRALVHDNKFENIRGNSIVLEGTGGEIFNNRILNVPVGIGIYANSNRAFIANNYIHTIGLGISKGIVLPSISSSGTRVVFNSVNIMGTDPVNGRGIEVLGGSGHVIKNNIFANNGGGYAAYFNSIPQSADINYNNYYTIGSNFGYSGGVLFNDLLSWRLKTNGDINSKDVNPRFKGDTTLLPFQKQLNGAGVLVPGVILDIDGEIRNLQAPDIGAQEFMVDFGVNRLINPSNLCNQTDSTPVVVFLRQFGDIPFLDLKLAYQVNNGVIFYDTIPGSINNDLEFTFKKTQDLSNKGTYNFKIWLVDNGDDNQNNDTLVVTRQNKDLPVVDFTYSTKCSGEAVPFIGTASIVSGFIDRIEWDFGDSTIGIGFTPSHIYDTSGKYVVTMRAFSDQGCYGEIKKSIELINSPIASFKVQDACFGQPVLPINTTTIKPGASIISYKWNFGDGFISNDYQPSRIYSQTGQYDISLIVQSNNGCIDSVKKAVSIFKFDSLSYNLIQPIQKFICEGTPLPLFATGASSYQWYRNGISIPSATDSVFRATQPGIYRVDFITKGGCSSTSIDSIVLQLAKAPDAQFSFDTYCVGIPIKFLNKSVVDPLTKVSYSWNFGDGTKVENVFSPLYTYKVSGLYTISLITTSSVCINQKDTAKLEIKVEDAPKGIRYDPVSAILNTQQQLSARDFGIKYEWTPSDQLSNANIMDPVLTATREQEYLISISNIAGCVTIDTIKIFLFSNYDIIVPKAFTPNGDGKNDRLYPFKIGIKTMN